MSITEFNRANREIGQMAKKQEGWAALDEFERDIEMMNQDPVSEEEES